MHYSDHRRGRHDRPQADRAAGQGRQLNGKPIDQLTLIDVVAPETPGGFRRRGRLSTADLSAPGVGREADRRTGRR